MKHPCVADGLTLVSFEGRRQINESAGALMGYERCFGPKRLNCLEAVHHALGDLDAPPPRARLDHGFEALSEVALLEGMSPARHS